MERKRPEWDDVVFVTVMIGVAVGLGVLLTIGYVADSTELMDIANGLLIFGWPLLLVIGWIVLRYRKRNR